MCYTISYTMLRSICCIHVYLYYTYNILIFGIMFVHRICYFHKDSKLIGMVSLHVYDGVTSPYAFMCMTVAVALSAFMCMTVSLALKPSCV